MSASPGTTVLIPGSGLAPATMAVVEIRSTPVELTSTEIRFSETLYPLTIVVARKP